MYIEIPTWEDGNWRMTSFETRDLYKSFVESLFKKPGEYEFDDISELFNEQARIFNKRGYYCESPRNSKDFITYWEDQKLKSRVGVIFKSGKKIWYLTRDYYFWINFLKIFEKESKKFIFPQVWDTHYHIALYELLAELNYSHGALLKKRQIGSSYFHMAKVINYYWFEEGNTLKIGASLKKYINEVDGVWKILNEYRNFLDKNVEWKRPCDPDKTYSWQQRWQVPEENEFGQKTKTYVGNMSTITGTSFEKDPVSGVGGNMTFFYYEEGGIAPTANTTYEFIRPALSSGMITTGFFMIAGSVGDLDQCKPLKDMVLRPHVNSIYAVASDLIDDKGTVGETALFVPEQWSMPPCIDKYGNSQVEEALKLILKERETWKKNLDPATYQLRISQKPINIHEAFAFRRESRFPLHLVNKQIQRIEDKKYPIEYVDLDYDEHNKIKIIKSNKLPIFVLGKEIRSIEDKSGVICIYERPMENASWGTYIASIDPVNADPTTTSESLCSIHIYKCSTEITKVDGGNIENYLERDGIVASWCGRFEDVKRTHERLEMLMELYKARAVVEVQVSLFTQYMIGKKKQHLLIPRRDLLSFNKEMKNDSQAQHEYGWKNSKPVWEHIIKYGIEYLKEELDQVRKKNEDGSEGDVVKTIYGIERIPDIMLLKEMRDYQDGDGENYDRLISFCSLIAYATIQNNNMGIRKRVEKTNTNLENTEKFRNLIGGGEPKKKAPSPLSKPARSPFKHYR